MRIKTILIVVFTILVTIVIMQNNQEVNFYILFFEARIPNLVVMTMMAVAGFLIGIAAARPKKVKFDDQHPSYDNPTGNKNNTLSDEDRDYIN